MSSNVKIWIAILAVAAVALSLPASSLASSSSDAYAGPNGQGLAGIESEGGNGDPGSQAGDPGDPGSTATETGTLPFTGFDVGVLALVGIGLAGLGVGIRRLNRQPS